MGVGFGGLRGPTRRLIQLQEVSQLLLGRFLFDLDVIVKVAPGFLDEKGVVLLRNLEVFMRQAVDELND